MTGWDDLPAEVQELAFQGNQGQVDAGRHNAKPAAWWASACDLDMADALRLIRILVAERILGPEVAGKYCFTEKGNAWANGLAEARAKDDNPFGEPELIMIGKSATSATEVLEHAARLCPNLVFDRVCAFYAQSCRDPAPYHELARALVVLNDMAVATDEKGALGMRTKKWVDQYLLERGLGNLVFKPEDKGTVRCTQRTVLISGQPILMHEHFSMGSSSNVEQCISVYFVRFPATSRKITIGYCGPHLKA